VVVIGTGGLSHQLDGERAGFINKPFDLQFMQSLLDNPKWATQYTVEQLVEHTGSQGIELLMWLAARATIKGECARCKTPTTCPSPIPQPV
jgi:protocatechuate 4,5-dioxygenase beta chain